MQSTRLDYTETVSVLSKQLIVEDVALADLDEIPKPAARPGPWDSWPGTDWPGPRKK